MKLILIDGGPASGKNTLGELLISKLGEKSILLDLDTYVEQYNPKWIWDTEETKEKDQMNARVDIVSDVNKYLKEDYNIIVIGERFLSISDVNKFMTDIQTVCTVYLYHLSVPFELRERRLHLRGPHSLIDLKKDQHDRDVIKVWPGYVYENINSPEIDATNLHQLIKNDEGLVNVVNKI
jgi:hypothetical protein